MNFSVQKISKESWESFCTEAHVISFGEKRPSSTDRIDYAMLLTDEKNTPAAWVTCLEMDADTVYWQHGGVFPAYENTHFVLKGYAELIKWAMPRYSRITTRIENINRRMLKLATQMGFVVMGTFVVKQRVYLELALEF